MTQEQEPFLLHEKGETELDPKSSAAGERSSLSRWRSWKFQVLAHGVLITIYTVLSITAIRAHSKKSLAPRPAVDNIVIEYTNSLFQNLSDSPYAGKPSPEIDAAWTDLLAPMHIRITEAELRRDNQDSVALPEGGGYLGWLGVFHELHCIKMLREWHYAEYYHADLSAAEKEHITSHIDHCFEMLRQSAVCHADASLTTFKWHPEKTRPMFNASESIHTCVVWDKLMESLADRVVSDEEILRLDNPLFSRDL